MTEILLWGKSQSSPPLFKTLKWEVPFFPSYVSSRLQFQSLLDYIFKIEKTKQLVQDKVKIMTSAVTCTEVITYPVR